jgi:arginine/lysine/ornithine decarboxylase
MSTPIYDAIIKHKKKNSISFHTPGHKNSTDLPFESKLDYTELLDTDSLFSPSGAIKESEKQAAEFFNTKHTIFSAGGCTACIQTMLRLALPEGGKILMSRVTHISAVNAMSLLNIEPVWIKPDKSAGNDFCGRINKNEVLKLLNKHKDIKAVYITSPDYYGVISDIKSISNVCKEYSVPLLVDSAHGAHLLFIDKKLHPSSLGASLVSYSAHKTLPVLTGGAFLDIMDEKYIYNAKSSMLMFASTSPSYPIMASIDLAIDWLKKYNYKYKKLETRIKSIKALIKSCRIEQPLGLCDPLRISINVSSIGVSGTYALNIMKKYKIEPEYFDENYIILIATPFNTEKDFHFLEQAILEISKATSLGAKRYSISCESIPNRAMPLRQAIFKKSFLIKTCKAEGKISAQAICSCPPGVPIVIPGEVIDGDAVIKLIKSGVLYIKVVY